MTAVRGSVVVVTGASSGLGRAIAIEVARRGGSLVLAARAGDALAQTARYCSGAGGSALVVETDVTREDEVERLAAAAIDAHGRIDAWINNAGVTLYALLEQASLEDHRRVIETNLVGAMVGARAVIPVFRRQHRGVLINVGSVLSGIGHAFVPSYVVSKFGVHGLSEALRVELADIPDIHVCTVFPYAIDTPHFEVAANRLHHRPRALPPVQPPERVARAIARLIEHPRRTRYVPRIVALGLAVHAIAPRTSERLLLDVLRRWHFDERPTPVPRLGNLFAPSSGSGKIHGSQPPRLGTAQLLAWSSAQLVRVSVESAIRLMRRAQARVDRWRGRTPAHTPEAQSE
jgi:short-subunit dehydrogenase